MHEKCNWVSRIKSLDNFDSEISQTHSTYVYTRTRNTDLQRDSPSMVNFIFYLMINLFKF